MHAAEKYYRLPISLDDEVPVVRQIPGKRIKRRREIKYPIGKARALTVGNRTDGHTKWQDRRAKTQDQMSRM